MNGTLYFVVNSSSEGTTYGLVRLTDDEFRKFKTFIENLNQNSYYKGMPTISVYRIDDAGILKEFDYNPNEWPWSKDYVDPESVFYLDGKTYTFVDSYFVTEYYSELECVIGGD